MSIKKTLNEISSIFSGKWEVKRQIWPYQEGKFATYHTGKRMALDMNIETMEEAQALCDYYNENGTD